MSDLLVVALFSSVAMLAAWFWQQKHNNAGIVDIVWAFCMMLAGPWYAVNGTAPIGLKTVLALMTLAWFLRLSLHLLLRFKSEREDGRYQTMRKAMGKYGAVGFLLLFQLQAGFVWFLSLPFWGVVQNTQPELIWIVCAVILVLFALWGEASADQQLTVFRKNPSNKGLTCRDGWWRYCRHPNYFFEWLHWFAYPILGMGSPYQYELWLAPIVMFCFLNFFTGIPYTERQALLSRGDEYRHYQQTTHAFFPWWPKSGVAISHNDQSRSD